MGNAEVEQPDGSIRARIAQGTQQTVGPLLVGVLGTLRGDEGQPVGARLELRVHRRLGVPGPGIVQIESGSGIDIEGVGSVRLVAVIDAPSGATSSEARAQVFLELDLGDDAS